MCLTFCPTCVAAASTVTPQADSSNTLDYAPYVPERDGPLSEMASRAFMLAPSMSDIWTLRSGRRPLFLVDSIPIGTGTTRGDSTIPPRTRPPPVGWWSTQHQGLGFEGLHALAPIWVSVL